MAGGTTISLLPVGTLASPVDAALASPPILELRGGPIGAAFISALGDARIAVNDADGLLYASENAGPYLPLATGASSPWTRAAFVVSLNLPGDTAVDPNADNVTSLGTAALRWASVNVGAGATGGVRVFDTLGGPTPTAELKSALKFSAAGGAGALDVEFARFAAKKFSVGDGAGGSGALLPLTDLDVDGTLGDATHRWINVFSAELDMPASAGDPAVTAGVGKLYTKGAGPLTQLWFVDGAGVPHQITPSGVASPWQRILNIVSLTVGTDTEVNPGTDNFTSFGTDALRWSNVYATIFTASDGAPANNATLKLGNPNQFLVGDGAGGAGSVMPESSDVGVLGNAGARWLSAVTASTGGFYVWPVGPLSPNPRARLHVSLDLGPGGGTAPNVGLAWESANVFSVTNGAASSGSIVPSVNSDLATAFLGRGNGAAQKQWSRVDAVNFRVFGLSPGNAFPMATYSSDSAQFGDGANPADTIIRRFGTAPLPSFEFASGGDTPQLLPQLWNQGAIGDQATAGVGTLFKSWAKMDIGPLGVSVYATGPAVQPTARLSDAALTMGPGAALPVDVGIVRSATTPTTMEVTNGAALSGNLQPRITATGTLGTTGVATSKAWLSVAVTGSYGVYNSAADASPTASLSATAVEFGPVGGPVDVGLKRSITAVNALDVTNGALGSGSIQPLVSGSGKLGIAGVPAARAFQSVAATGAFVVHTVATQVNPEVTMTTTAAGGSVAMGPTGGAAPPDIEINWKSTGVIALKAGAASGSMVPDLDTQGSLGVNGVGGRIWASLSATSLAAYAAGVDVQPKVEMRSTLPGGEIRMGLGGVALNVPDVYLSRTGAGTLTVDDGAGNGITIVPSVDGTGNIGTAPKRFGLVRAVTITSGDVCFDDQTCRICGQPFAEGDDIMLRVIGIEPDGDTGRKLTRTVPAHHGCK